MKSTLLAFFSFSQFPKGQREDTCVHLSGFDLQVDKIGFWWGLFFVKVQNPVGSFHGSQASKEDGKYLRCRRRNKILNDFTVDGNCTHRNNSFMVRVWLAVTFCLCLACQLLKAMFYSAPDRRIFGSLMNELGWKFVEESAGNCHFE